MISVSPTFCFENKTVPLAIICTIVATNVPNIMQWLSAHAYFLSLHVHTMSGLEVHRLQCRVWFKRQGYHKLRVGTDWAGKVRWQLTGIKALCLSSLFPYLIQESASTRRRMSQWVGRKGWQPEKNGISHSTLALIDKDCHTAEWQRSL